MGENKKDFSKKDAARAASSLRRSRDWNPEAVLSRKKNPLEKLREEDRERQTAQSYQATDVCEACAAEREATGDMTALCPEHFSAMMEGLL